MYIRCPTVILFLRNYQSFFSQDKYLQKVRELVHFRESRLPFLAVSFLFPDMVIYFKKINCGLHPHPS